MDLPAQGGRGSGSTRENACAWAGLTLLVASGILNSTALSLILFTLSGAKVLMTLLQKCFLGTVPNPL